MNDNPKFLNPLVEIRRHTNHLPHWQQDNATFFVTFRLGDSIPESKLAPWRDARDAWLQLNPKPWTFEKESEYHDRFSRKIEEWLDAGAGSCLLRDPVAAKIVGDALDHFEDERCRQHAWVVMPNHVHALFSLLGGYKLETVMHSWKSYSAHAINKVLGRAGELWQREYFDRMIRDVEHFERCRRYIENNPVKARLRDGQFLPFAKA
jgi:REP element-mobilizing transposase RayT